MLHAMKCEKGFHACKSSASSYSWTLILLLLYIQKVFCLGCIFRERTTMRIHGNSVPPSSPLIKHRIIETCIWNIFGWILEDQNMKAFQKLGWMKSCSIKECQRSIQGFFFPFRIQHLAAIQLLFQDKARMQQLLYTVLHILLSHEYRIALLITQASHI